MKKGIILTSLVVLTLICLAWLIIWKNVIHPKNTRLVFYETITASKYNRHNSNSAEQLESWLNNLNDLELIHLNHCEQIQYHNKRSSLNRRLVTLKENNDLPADIAILKSLDAKHVVPLKTMQKVAKRYFQDVPTLKKLNQIGQTEFENVMSEIKIFESELLASDFSGTLKDLATGPKNFKSNSKEVELIYNRLIFKAEQELTSRFFSYDIPKGTANVSEQAHRWSASAQYNRKRNSMTAFLNAEQYDTNIAAFISVHEIYPGHHLSANAGLGNPLCPGDNPTAFSWLGEGWATYVEFIADEEGFFEKPQHKLAWLDYRLTRAMRIILDVRRMEGITDYNELKQIWTQTMPPRLAGNFDLEFNRLLKSHHQHLNYILGYRAILAAKVRLIEKFGSKFDEKKFHDAILRLEHTEPLMLYETLRIAMDIPTEFQE